MKRWLGFICMLAIFGTISVGDPLFGLMPELRPHAEKCRKFILEKYTAFMNRAPYACRCQGKESRYSGKKPKRVWAFEKKRVKKTGLRRFVKPSYSFNRGSIAQPLVEKVIEVAAALPVDKPESKESRRIEKDEREADSYVKVMRKQKRKHQFDYSPAQPTSYAQTPPMPSYSPPMPFAAQAPISQPVQYPQSMMQSQPMYQNNGAQITACAMQMQASAMAMQAQASAMMMQPQQPVPMMQQAVPMHGGVPGGADKQDKINRLMQKISVLGVHGAGLVLKLLDIEFDIIEQLLAGAGGQVVNALVKKRDNMLQQSSPLICSTYDLVIDLAALAGKESKDPCLYNYFVRKGKCDTGSTAAHGRKKFLRTMIYELEQYYQMIEKMQNIVG